MKKIFILVLIISFFSNFFVTQAKNSPHPLTPSPLKGEGGIKSNSSLKVKKKKIIKKCFIVTAYYSPLPNQKYYAKGSYIRDIILNGRGYRGASGKKVFSGMLAAPSNYKFGTKIYLNGLGVAEVADRGGAIVNAGVRGHACDRIDIWVGWGETGLKKALYWGKRKVYGNFMSRNSKVTLNINNFKAPNYVLKNAFRVYSNPVFSKGIGTKNPKSDIIALQKYLKKKCLYNGKIDGNYYNILYIILDIQKKHNIVKTGNEAWAGYWSYNTRKLFLDGKIKNGNCKKVPLSNFPPKGERIAIKKKIIKKEIKNIYPLEEILEKPCSKKSDKELIKKYQELFKEIGLYNGKIDGDYNKIIGVVVDFQLKNKLIKDKNNIAAGFIGPKTREKLKEVYKKIIDDKIEKKKKQEAEKQRIKQEKNKEIAEIINSMAKLEIKASGENVVILQKTLKHFGFFDYKETGYFGEKTKEALMKYQISRKIIKSKNDVGAGYVGPKTRESLKKDLLKDKSLLGKLKKNKDKFYVVSKIVKEV